ncbi:Uncharacterized protein Fot_11736 [Forsythia ovata]|uniref:Uncharacterized protein n=1 Tax=Forsythia ovata TaxID=205694 RepID=A0ABD1WKX5_9LAMI
MPPESFWVSKDAEYDWIDRLKLSRRLISVMPKKFLMLNHPNGFLIVQLLPVCCVVSHNKQSIPANGIEGVIAKLQRMSMSSGGNNTPFQSQFSTLKSLAGLDKAAGASCGAAGMAESAGGTNPRADKPSSTATPMATLERSSRGGAPIAAFPVCARQVVGPVVALGASPRTAAVLTGLLESILGGVRPVEMKLEVAEGNSAPVSINSGGLGGGGYMHEGISMCQGYVCQKREDGGNNSDGRKAPNAEENERGKKKAFLRAFGDNTIVMSMPVGRLSSKVRNILYLFESLVD